jgi:hypothetical protein
MYVCDICDEIYMYVIYVMKCVYEYKCMPMNVRLEKIFAFCIEQISATTLLLAATSRLTKIIIGLTISTTKKASEINKIFFCGQKSSHQKIKTPKRKTLIFIDFVRPSKIGDVAVIFGNQRKITENKITSAAAPEDKVYF